MGRPLREGEHARLWILTRGLGGDAVGMFRVQDLLMRKAGAFSGQVAAGSKLETLVPLVTAILPPLVVACAAPHIFYSALEFSGTFRLVLFGALRRQPPDGPIPFASSGFFVRRAPLELFSAPAEHNRKVVSFFTLV